MEFLWKYCGKQQLRKKRNITNSTEGTCKVLHLEWNNLTPQLRLGQTASEGRKGPGSRGGGHVEHELAVCPGGINQLCGEYLHQEYAVIWSPQCKKYTEAPCRATNSAKGLQYLVHNRKLREMGLGWRRNLMGDLRGIVEKMDLNIASTRGYQHRCGNGNSSWS